MAGYRYLIFTLLFIIASCAQVGQITGGGADTYAPKPVEENVSPASGSKNFNGSHIKIPFNEFFKLKNPSVNIVMIPPHANINASFKGKTLLLDWDDSLRENTTYAIYLNGAIQDLNESNDSIIQYFFSTGDVLDTLSYRIQVKDAWTNEPVSKATVVLYDGFTKELRSFASTGPKGYAEMRCLRNGEYAMSVFKDLNADMEYQPNEPIAFSSNERITLLKSRVDSIPYRLYTPLLEPKITTKRFIGPNSYIIAANRPLLKTAFTINDELIPEDKVIYHTNDSVQLFWNTAGVTRAEITVQNATFNDTLSLRYSEKTTNAPLLFSSKNRSNTYAPTDTICFVLNDLITSIDTSLIKIQTLTDSTYLKDYVVLLDKNTVCFLFDKKELSRLVFEFSPNAVASTRDSIGLEEFIITLNPDRKYGVINLKLNGYKSPVILQTIKGGKLFMETPIASPPESFRLQELAPGQYTFVIIEDSNGNGKWDVGDYETRKQPEALDVFSTPTTIRANWEVVLELIPSK